MVLPFRRKGTGNKEDGPVDQDIEDIMNEAEGVETGEVGPALELPPEDVLTDEADVAEKMARSAQTVIDTCMDLRRGENILIVCDPTTTDVGQALHDAASQRSDLSLIHI